MNDDERHVLLVLGLLMDEARVLLLGDDEVRLRPSQLRVIGYVPPDRGINITELAERVGMTKQGIGQFVTQLSNDGFLAIEGDPDDRRVRIVRRTAAGNDATHHLAVKLRKLEQRWSRRVGAQRYREFRSVLDELAGIA